MARRSDLDRVLRSEAARLFPDPTKTRFASKKMLLSSLPRHRRGTGRVIEERHLAHQ
jgi:hypothetical protein